MRRLTLLLTFFTLAARTFAAEEAETVTKAEKALSVVRVNVTNQPWDFGKPWGKRTPFSRKAIGAVLPGGRVLVTAELVANASYVELETAEGGQKAAASVEAVDYECNLALIKPDDGEFLKALAPIEVAPAKVGDELAIWQLETNGNLLVTRGPITTAELQRYPADDSPFLIYRVTTRLQFRDTSFPLPAVKGDKLAGLVQRYDNNSNNADVIPAPVIEHFLKDAAKPPYKGFPRTGMAFATTRDPQLRRYAGLKEGNGGVYVTDVLAGSPAAVAGLEKGDVILKIDGQTVDRDGNYNDADYGRIALAHLIGAKHYDGDVAKFTVQRQGEVKELDVTVAHRPVESFVVEPYVIDRAPRFYILGGLILQELSRQYLKEWGLDWRKKAPEQFVFLDGQQSELFKDGTQKVVFLSRVLPTEDTIGYEDLNSIIVTAINGVPLKNITDIPAALAKAENGVHKVQFDGEPGTIYLDAERVAADEGLLMKKYRLPAIKRLE